MPLPGAPNPLQSLEQEPTARLSSYFEKRQKKQGPTSLGDAPVAPSMSSVPAVSAPTASAGAAPRGAGGKSPTGFVGFEQYFGANAPAIEKMAQGALASAAAPRPTAGQMAKVAPTSLQAGVPRGVSFGLSAPPRIGFGKQTNEIKTQTGPAPMTTEQQIAQAKAGQERLKTLGEPGGYQAQAQYSPELERFDAMLMGGMLPQQTKAEASRLGALERRLTEQQAQRERSNQQAQREAADREARFYAYYGTPTNDEAERQSRAYWDSLSPEMQQAFLERSQRGAKTSSVGGTV